MEFLFLSRKGNSICGMLSLGDYTSIRCRWPGGNWICGLSSLSSSVLLVIDLGAKGVLRGEEIVG